MIEYTTIFFYNNIGKKRRAKIAKIFFEKSVQRNKKSCIFATSFHER